MHSVPLSEVDLNPMRGEAQLYLEKAEQSLFNRLFTEVEAGEYGKAATVVSLMERLSLV